MSKYKTKEIISTFLLAGETFIPEMYLRQHGITIVLVDHLLKSMRKNIHYSKGTRQSLFSKRHGL